MFDGPVTVPATRPNPREFLDVTVGEQAMRGFLHGLPGVDQVGLEARAAGLATRSIKTTAKKYAIDLAISMIDLTTLEGQDTPGKVRSLGSVATMVALRGLPLSSASSPKNSPGPSRATSSPERSTLTPPSDTRNSSCPRSPWRITTSPGR